MAEEADDVADEGYLGFNQWWFLGIIRRCENGAKQPKDNQHCEHSWEE